MTLQTLEQLRKTTLSDVWLSDDNFAESVIYTPADGSRLRMVRVHATPQQRVDYDDANQTETLVDELIVLCGRDQCLKDSDGNEIGGINTPQAGDSVLRAANVDPSQRKYYWTGEIRTQSPHKWRLIFERRQREATGVEGG